MPRASGANTVPTRPANQASDGHTNQSDVPARTRLIKAGIDLVRHNGYSATSVEQICAAAGVSKGAFFHYFKGKEALAEACMEAWTEGIAQMLAAAPFMAQPSPLERLRGCLDHFISIFEPQGSAASCLIGTTVQECAVSHPQLRQSAERSFSRLGEFLGGLIEEAAQSRGRSLDSMGLARLFISAIQGGIILRKAGAPPDVVPVSLRHVRDYIMGLLLLKVSGPAGG
ncbi:TetR/AcrR family transcriptional regulator [bacterium]|nr:TetR/AcrR family transcriptional regulator [bacterium]